MLELVNFLAAVVFVTLAVVALFALVVLTVGATLAAIDAVALGLKAVVLATLNAATRVSAFVTSLFKPSK